MKPPKSTARSIATRLLSLSAVFAIATCGLVPSAWAQKPHVNPLSPKTPVEKKPENVPTTAHDMTSADVEAFLDGLMPLQLEQNDVAGAVVAIVKDGKVLLVKGYGYADVA